jgi:calcium-dependent protein kinase
LEKKWDSISNTKGHHQNTHDLQINVKSIIDKDLDFAAYKALMA